MTRMGNDLEIGFPHVGTHDAQTGVEANMKVLKVKEPFPQGDFGAGCPTHRTAKRGSSMMMRVA